MAWDYEVSNYSGNIEVYFGKDEMELNTWSAGVGG